MHSKENGDKDGERRTVRAIQQGYEIGPHKELDYSQRGH